MPKLPDTSLIHLHRLTRAPVTVDRLEGAAWRVSDSGSATPLAVGDELTLGETLALEEGAVLDAGPVHLRGGRRGQAHVLVRDASFRTNPSRADVPRLLLQLAQIEEQAGLLGGDPLAVRGGPETELERAASSDFARCNLVLAAARELPEAVAREAGAVTLFVNEETAFVAMSELSAGRLRSVMEALERPVNPHMVSADVLAELIERVYGGGRAPDVC